MQSRLDHHPSKECYTNEPNGDYEEKNSFGDQMMRSHFSISDDEDDKVDIDHIQPDLLDLAEQEDELKHTRFNELERLKTLMVKNNKSIEEYDSDGIDPYDGDCNSDMSPTKKQYSDWKENRAYEHDSDEIGEEHDHVVQPSKKITISSTDIRAGGEKRENGCSDKQEDDNDSDEVDIYDDIGQGEGNSARPRPNPIWSNIHDKHKENSINHEHDEPRPEIKSFDPKSKADIKEHVEEKSTFVNPYENFLKLREQRTDNLPLLEGYLKKKSPRLLQGYQTRYFVLKDRKLAYYKNETKERLQGCLNFTLLDVKIDAPKSKRLKISIPGASRSFNLKAKTPEEAQKWVEAIKKHLEVSDDNKLRIHNLIVKKKEFWKFDRISEAQLLASADTDFFHELIIRTKNVIAKLQRSITRSHYDHVAILLKYSSGEIVLLESTGQIGVGLCRWRTFKKNDWHLLYSKMVYRKLNYDRDDELITIIEKFVKNVVGKKYKVTTATLFKKKSLNREDGDNNKTFFCSELVAACYKKMGLLQPEISSSSYWPGSFSTEKKLKLLKGAELGEEQLIDFNI